MDYSVEQTYSVLSDIVKICVAHGVRRAFLSPGSRSAPVALSFMRNNDVECFNIPDERSCAYMALGAARSAKEPVAIVCTSGTAALNFAPAIAEAFFSNISLIVFTADRPAAWIGQQDNQAIYQHNIYSPHVNKYVCLPERYDNAEDVWYAQRSINEALIAATTPAFAPVHINVPLREPLYTKEEKVISYTEVKIIKKERPTDERLPDELFTELSKYYRVLFAAGHNLPDKNLKNEVGKFFSENAYPLVADVCSNLHGMEDAITSYDTPEIKNHEELLPELLITFGSGFTSKHLKEFLRSEKIKTHWHLGEGDVVADTFFHLEKIIPVSAQQFFNICNDKNFTSDASYKEAWRKFSEENKPAQTNEWTEGNIVSFIQQNLPQHSVLHLGNSLPVRHVLKNNLLHESIEVFSNRGTSGIDGCLSAVAGASIINEAIHTIIIGDMSFMYDRNALWNNYLKGNLKIIILNNHGGRIFEKLPGAVAQKELQEYFVTNQPLHFEDTSKQHDCKYYKATDFSSLEIAMIELYSSAFDAPQILEIEILQS